MKDRPLLTASLVIAVTVLTITLARAKGTGESVQTPDHQVVADALGGVWIIDRHGNPKFQDRPR